MSGGRLFVIGLGPGDLALLTPEAQAALDHCTDLFGYLPYIERLPERPGTRHHASDNREELDRARAALTLAAEGQMVGVVSGGDPGVFAMASAVFEAIESGPAAWRALEVTVIPGISAMLAAAARVGAPLGHDFAVVSLSDNLKPWPLVLERLGAAASAGFALALYNPISRARPWQLGAALDHLRGILPAETPVVFATAVSRPDERIEIVTLAEAEPLRADMRTLVLIGTAETRRIARGEGRRDWLYAPRKVSA
ncbi:precorrin-3B C(17)-methyltransferase [Acidisoma sp.]|uniref:precorrin-3B C(17)-methyltransferase n=1 Tax=Acidisoma sp. TaxID=1872115 RepID=UPI003B000377